MADLSRYETSKHSETPVYLQLAFEGEPLYANDDGGNEDKSLPMGLMVIGKDAADIRRLVRRQHNENIKKAMRTRGKQFGDADYNARMLVAACVKDFKNIKFGAEEWKWSPDRVLELFDRCPFIYEQVSDFVEDRENFLGN